MQALLSLLLGLARAVLWPLYLILLAYVARVAPWPRSLAILVSALLTGAAPAILVHDLLRWLTRPGGWPERHLDVPRQVARQLGAAARFLATTAVVFLLPVYLFDHELLAPQGRPLAAPALGRVLVVCFELTVWASCLRLVRGRSALLEWLAQMVVAPPDGERRAGGAHSVPTAAAMPTSQLATASSRARAGLVWLGQRRRLVAGMLLAAIATIILLDVRGYHFTARRLAVGGSQTAAVIMLAAAIYHMIARAISQNAWRWARPSRFWAVALTSAVARRPSVRTRNPVATAAPELGAGSSTLTDPALDVVTLDDLVVSCRRLLAFAVAALALLATAYIWEVDLALVRFLLGQSLWAPDGQTPVTVGNALEASVVILLGWLAWRYMSTLFAVTIFPRMPDDPGARFAVVTLCRYAVLGLSAMGALSAIHLDLAKIGVVLAALGVGLGFGLQEIVSNFVCGIILLLERPIRIGDIVTVAGLTGKVDRINIRATTIVNSDNQSMIVPNREFITGNLVNWTLKDKIVRVPIKVGVAYGTDPDQVVALLLRIAADDPDVMLNPAPSAALEGFGESSLLFSFSAFVPDPGVSGDVRHRLCREIQRRFTAEGIVMPFPTHELHLSRVADELLRASEAPHDGPISRTTERADAASKTPPPPHTYPVSTGTDSPVQLGTVD